MEILCWIKPTGLLDMGFIHVDVKRVIGKLPQKRQIPAIFQQPFLEDHQTGGDDLKNPVKVMVTQSPPQWRSLTSQSTL